MIAMKILIFILIVSVMEACCGSNNNVHLLKTLLQRLQRAVTQENSNTINNDDCMKSSTTQSKHVNKLINQNIDLDSNDDEECKDTTTYENRIFNKISKTKEMIRRSVEYENNFDHADYDDHGGHVFHTGDENILFPTEINLEADDQNNANNGKMTSNIDTDIFTEVTSLEDYSLSDETDSDSPSSISKESNSDNSTDEDSSEDSTSDDSNNIDSNEDSDNSNSNGSKDKSDNDNDDSSGNNSKDSSNGDDEDSRDDGSENITYNDSIEVTTNEDITDNDDDTTELQPSQPKPVAHDDWESMTDDGSVSSASSSDEKIASQDSQNKVNENISLEIKSSTSIEYSTTVNSFDSDDILHDDADDFTTKLYISDILHKVPRESSSDESLSVTKPMLDLNQDNEDNLNLFSAHNNSMANIQNKNLKNEASQSDNHVTTQIVHNLVNDLAMTTEPYNSLHNNAMGIENRDNNEIDLHKYLNNNGTELHKLVGKDGVDTHKSMQKSVTEPNRLMFSKIMNSNKPILNNGTEPHKSKYLNFIDPYEFQQNIGNFSDRVVNSNNTGPDIFENYNGTNPHKSIYPNNTKTHNINNLNGNSIKNMNDLKNSEYPLLQNESTVINFIIIERHKLEDLLELNGTSKNIFMKQKIDQYLSKLFEIAINNFNHSLKLLKKDLHLSFKDIIYTLNFEDKTIPAEILDINIPELIIIDFLKYNEGFNNGKNQEKNQNINNKKSSILPHDLAKEFESSGTTEVANALENNPITDNNPSNPDNESKPMDIQFPKSYLDHKEHTNATKTANESEPLQLGGYSPKSYLENNADIHPNKTVSESQPMNGAEPMNSMFPNTHIENDIDRHTNQDVYESEPMNRMFSNTHLNEKPDLHIKEDDYEPERMNSRFLKTYLDDESNIQHNKTAYESESTNSIFPNTYVGNVADIHHNEGGYESEPIESAFQKPYLENKAENHPNKTSHRSGSMDTFITKSYFQNSKYKFPNNTGHESESTNSFFKKSYPVNKTDIYPNKTDYEPKPISKSIQKSYLENNVDRNAGKIVDEYVQLGKLFKKSSLEDEVKIYPNKSGKESEPIDKLLFSKSYLERGVGRKSNRTFNILEPMGTGFQKPYLENEGSGKRNRTMTLHVGNITDIIIIASEESKFKVKKDTDMSRLTIELAQADVNDKKRRKYISNVINKLNLEIYKEKRNYGNITYNNLNKHSKEAFSDKGQLARDNNSVIYFGENQITRENNSRISLAKKHLTTIDNSRVSWDGKQIAADDYADDYQDNYSAKPLVNNQISRDSYLDIPLDKDQISRDYISKNFNANTNQNIESIQEIPSKINEVLNHNQIYPEKTGQNINNDVPNSRTGMLNQNRLLMSKINKKLANDTLIQDQSSRDKIKGQIRNKSGLIEINQDQTLNDNTHQKHGHDVPLSLKHLLNQDNISMNKIKKKPGNDVHQSLTNELYRDQSYTDEIDQKPNLDMSTLLTSLSPMILGEEEIVLNTEVIDHKPDLDKSNLVTSLSPMILDEEEMVLYRDKLDLKNNLDMSTLLTSLSPMILEEEGIVLNITENINEPENINVVSQRIISQENKDGLYIRNVTQIVKLLQEMVQSQKLTNSQMGELQLEHNESLIEQRHTNEILHNIININSLLEANGHLVMLPRAENGVPMNWSMSVKRCASHSVVPFIPKTHHDLSWLFHLCESIWEEGIWIPATYSSYLRQLQWIDGNDASEVLGKFLNNSNIPVDLNYRGKHVDTNVTTENIDITEDTNLTTETNMIYFDTVQEPHTSDDETHPSDENNEDYCLTIVIGKDLSRKIEFNHCGEELWPMVCIL